MEGEKRRRAERTSNSVVESAKLLPEWYLCRLAHLPLPLPSPWKVCGLDPTVVRQQNLYQEGDSTHFGQPLVDCHIRQCWEELAQKVDLANRRAQVDSFNKSVCLCVCARVCLCLSVCGQ